MHIQIFIIINIILGGIVGGVITAIFERNGELQLTPKPLGERRINLGLLAYVIVGLLHI